MPFARYFEGFSAGRFVCKTDQKSKSIELKGPSEQILKPNSELQSIK